MKTQNGTRKKQITEWQKEQNHRDCGNQVSNELRCKCAPADFPFAKGTSKRRGPSAIDFTGGCEISFGQVHQKRFDRLTFKQPKTEC